MIYTKIFENSKKKFKLDESASIFFSILSS